MLKKKMSGKQCQKEIREGENENLTKDDIVIRLFNKNVLIIIFIWGEGFKNFSRIISFNLQ